MKAPIFRICSIAMAALAFGSVHAQQPSYGPPVNLETAKKIATASLAEARRSNFRMAVYIVDTHGVPVYLEVLDDTQHASPNLALQKARTAANYRRPTKALEDAIAGGRMAQLSIPDALMLEGGEPIIIAGKLVGAVGVSGGTSVQDGQVARAGLEVLK